jgi:ABC-type uncharacterized transport system fused permease/ATPase subunit
MRDKLASFQAFAARVLQLSTPYFQSEQKWRARGMFAAIVALNLASVYMAVLFNQWYNLFYTRSKARTSWSSGTRSGASATWPSSRSSSRSTAST